MKAGYPPIDIKFTDRISYYNAFEEYHVKHNPGAMEKLLAEKHIPLAQEEFYCRGSFAMLHRGRPNEKDLRDAGNFAVTMTKRISSD